MLVQDFMDKVRPFGLATEGNEKILRTLFGKDRDITEDELFERALSQDYLECITVVGHRKKASSDN